MDGEKKNTQNTQDSVQDTQETKEAAGVGKDTAPAENAVESKETSKAGNAGGKTFQQDEVTRMMAREKKQGGTAALRALGIDPDNAEQVKAVKAWIASQKTEAQKASEQAVAQAAKEAEFTARLRRAEAKAEAMVAGIQPQFVDDAVVIVLAKAEGDEPDYKTLMGELKTKYPVWFEKPDPETQAGQNGTGLTVRSSVNDKDKAGKNSLGARLGTARKQAGPSGKSKFW